MGKKRLGLYLIGYNLENRSKDMINPVTFIVFANNETDALELVSSEYPALNSIETYTCIGPLDCEHTGVHGFLDDIHDLQDSNTSLIRQWQGGVEVEDDDPSELFAQGAVEGEIVITEDDNTCAVAEVKSPNPLDNALVEDVNPSSEVRNTYPNVALEPNVSYLL